VKTEWEVVNEVMENAALLERLISLRMERHGETRDSAMSWAIEKMREDKSQLEWRRRWAKRLSR